MRHQREQRLNWAVPLPGKALVIISKSLPASREVAQHGLNLSSASASILSCSPTDLRPQANNKSRPGDENHVVQVIFKRFPERGLLQLLEDLRVGLRAGAAL